MIKMEPRTYFKVQQLIEYMSSTCCLGISAKLIHTLFINFDCSPISFITHNYMLSKDY